MKIFRQDSIPFARSNFHYAFKNFTPTLGRRLPPPPAIAIPSGLYVFDGALLQSAYGVNTPWRQHGLFVMITAQHVKRMKAIDPISGEMTVAPQEPGYGLNIVGVYQDPLTQSWGVPMCRLATQLAGEDFIRNTWYDVHSLSDLGILLAAVRAALIADVIVVSVYAADELPLDLYVWINAWLPRRNSREGAFTALIGAGTPQDPQSVRTRDYLQAVACKARLDFIPLFQPRGESE